MGWTDYIGPVVKEVGPEVAKLVAGGAGAAAANGITQEAYRKILENLEKRFASYDSLAPADYKTVAPERLGPSATANIADDPRSTVDQDAAIDQLDAISKSGGLTLADKAALNDLERTLNRNTSARSKSTANQFAARGQLGSGAQLAMEMQNNQDAAENANQRGESIAAQAQKRAMDAVLSKGTMSRNRGNDAYARKLAAAQAADSIAKYNASMSTEAQNANNRLAGQSYADQLAKLSGETKLTDSMNNAILGSAHGNADTVDRVTGAGINGIGAVSGAVRRASNSPTTESPTTPDSSNGDIADTGYLPESGAGPVQQPAYGDYSLPDDTEGIA